MSRFSQSSRIHVAPPKQLQARPPQSRFIPRLEALEELILPSATAATVGSVAPAMVVTDSILDCFSSTSLTKAYTVFQNGVRYLSLTAAVSSQFNGSDGPIGGLPSPTANPNALAGTPSIGQVTFTVTDPKGDVIGTPLTIPVVNGAAAGTYLIPQNVVGGSYSVQANYTVTTAPPKYVGNVAFWPSSATGSVSVPAVQPQIFAVGAAAGGMPLVNVYQSSTGAYLYTIDAFEKFTGGVRVATGVWNGQDVVIAAAGPGGLPLVRVFQGDTGKLLFSFLAFDSGFAGGVYVAAGDLKGDGSLAIVTGADAAPYGLPMVSVHDVMGNFLAPYMDAFGAGFHGGVRVAVADLTGTGQDDIVAAAGPGGSSEVQIINGRTFAKEQEFTAFDSGFQGGVFVAAGTVDQSGVDRLIFGTGAGPTPTVRIEDGYGQWIANNSNVYPGYTGAVPVAVINGLGQSQDLVLTGTGTNSSSEVTAFDAMLNPLSRTFPTFPGFTGGSYVG